MKKVIVVFDVDTEDSKIAATLVSFAMRQITNSPLPDGWDERIRREYQIFMEPM
jgi:hypothetical protein